MASIPVLDAQAKLVSIPEHGEPDPHREAQLRCRLYHRRIDSQPVGLGNLVLEAGPFEHVALCAEGVRDHNLGARLYVLLVNPLTNSGCVSIGPPDHVLGLVTPRLPSSEPIPRPSGSSPPPPGGPAVAQMSLLAIINSADPSARWTYIIVSCGIGFCNSGSPVSMAARITPHPALANLEHSLCTALGGGLECAVLLTFR